MANQKGAALIVVLSLLTGSLIIGLSSMQSSQVDERLAGNQKLSSEVQMAAEKAAAVGFERVGNVNLLMPLMRGGCSIADLFVDIEVVFNNGQKDDLRWASMLGSSDNWKAHLQESVDYGKPCDAYSSAWLATSNFEEPDFEAMYGELRGDANGLCDAPLQCEYRYISNGNGRFVVGMGAYVEGGDILAESRPVFVELDIDDPPPEVEWLFSSAPISLLTLINELKISGANNVTLDGGSGADILAQEGNKEQLVEDFTVSTGNKTFDPDVESIEEGDYSVSELMKVVQSLYDLSNVSDSIYFAREDTQMKDVPITKGIVVVAGNFVWNGQNDFEGTVLVLGPEVDYRGGGSGDLYGSLIHAPITATENTYDWVESGQYVDFSQVDRFDEENAWRYLDSGDEAVTSFDFSGGGGSTIRSDADAMMDVRDEYWGAVSNADFITWESY